MLKKVIDRLLRYRHPWRDIGFDELSEIYINALFRSLTISMSGIFVPVYMLRLSYRITDILMVYAWYFTARVAIDFIAAFTIAKYGPKHTLLTGQALQIVSSIFFLTLASMHWPIALVGILWGGSASFSYIAYDVDFSKIKHASHGGKELGFEQTMEKIGGVLGPIIGGFVATVFGPRYIFVVALLLLALSMKVLLRTKEPVRLNQKLRFRDFSVRGLLRPVLIPAAGLGVENTLSICLWPLFLGLFVLRDSSAFAKLGILASISVALAVLSAHIIGRLVDGQRGRYFLRLNATANALLHLFRPFVQTFPIALGVNMVNEVVTVGYRIPFMKGFYDSADDYPGFRIVYITVMQSFSSAFKALAWWFLVVLSLGIEARSTLYIGFVIAAFASLLLMTEKFKALNPKGA